MTPLFRKLNLKDQTRIHVLDAPASFVWELAALDGIDVARKVSAKDPVTFALAFAITAAQRDAHSRRLGERAQGDAILWLAYPKKSSKQYRCEFDRDAGWAVLGDAGFEPVRMVAIDEDWSALRFRRAKFIRTLTRGAEHAHSVEGRRRARGG